MNDPYNTDDLFKRSGQTDRHFPFNESAWEDMEARLGESDKKRPWPFWFWGSAFVVLAISMGWMWSQNQEAILTSLTGQQSMADEEPGSAPIVKVRSQKATMNEATVGVERLSTRGKRAKKEEENPAMVPGPANPEQEVLPAQRASSISETMPRRAVAAASGSSINSSKVPVSVATPASTIGSAPKVEETKESFTTAAANSQSTPGEIIASTSQPIFEEQKASLPRIESKKQTDSTPIEPQVEPVTTMAAGSLDKIYGAGIASGISSAASKWEMPKEEKPYGVGGWEIGWNFAPSLKEAGAVRIEYSGEPNQLINPIEYRTDDNRTIDLYNNGLTFKRKKKFVLNNFGLGVGKWLNESFYVSSSLYYMRFKTKYSFDPDASLDNVIVFDYKAKEERVSMDLRLQYMFNTEKRLMPFWGLRSLFTLHYSSEATQRVTSLYNEINEEKVTKFRSGFGFSGLGPEAGLRFRMTRRLDLGFRASYLFDNFKTDNGETIWLRTLDMGLQLNYRL